MFLAGAASKKNLFVLDASVEPTQVVQPTPTSTHRNIRGMLQDRKTRFNGNYKLKSHSENIEEFMKAQGHPWLLVKSIRHVPKSKTITIESDDMVRDDVVAAGLIHVRADHPVVPAGNERQLVLERGASTSANGRKLMCVAWWEEDCLVLFNHEPKTGMDFYIRHSLSEDDETLTCALKVVPKGSAPVHTVDVWRRV